MQPMLCCTLIDFDLVIVDMETRTGMSVGLFLGERV